MTLLKYCKNLFFTFLFLTLSFAADNRFRLKKANVLENKTINGESVKFISGNVVFTKGTLTLNCQEGRHYEKNDLAILYRRVTALQEGRTLTCDTLKFYSAEDRILSTGSPHVWDRDYDLKADTITVFTEQDSGVALGNVLLLQKGQIITADRIEYQKDPEKDGVSYTAIGNVVIEDSSRIATCGLARYDRTNEITILEIDPEINDNGQILSGEKIILTYKDEQMEKLHIPKKAYAVTPVNGFQHSRFDSLTVGDSLNFEDHIEGSRLTSFFKNGAMDSLRIIGMAKTLYHVFEDSIYQGKNNVSGDTIIMTFLEDELDRLRIIGGSEGKYSPDSVANDVGFPVVYSADKIQYRLKDEETDFEGKAIIKHEKTNLEAGFVTVNWQSNMLNAYPKLESDTVNAPQFPVIKEKGKDPMSGDAMTYNLETKKGRVIKGHTKADDGFYTGSQIRNETTKVFYIENSTYTTCDLDTAHFHFESKKMKVIQNDLVIARPIILHLGQIPIFGIPLGIFPHKGGQRHSGWIMPSYGESNKRGQYLSGLGFFWAPSDYWDSKFLVDFGDKEGALFKLNNVYRNRYKFNGGLSIRNQQYLSGSDNISDITGARKSSTNIRWNHTQKLRNNQSFNANVTYSTSGEYDFRKKYGQTEAERMNQKSISNVSYSKRWPKAKNSFATSYYSNRDLLIDDKVDSSSSYYVLPTKAGTQLNSVNKTFPKLSFRHGQSDLFPTKATDKKWFNTIKWNYGLSFNNKDRDYFESVYLDSSNSFSWMDSTGKLNAQNEQNSGWIHSSSINAPQKILKYISLNPSMNLKSVWVDKSFDGIWNDSTHSFTKVEKRGFAARTTGNFSLNANTQIYGLFPIPIGPVKAIRHVMSPSIGYSWTPDFSKPLFGQDLGYIITETDSTGKEYFHDKFAGTMGGSTPRNESKSMNFSLNNVFQAKVNKGEEDKKIDLLSWRMSSSYNFAADSMNLTNLRSTLRSKIAGKLNLDLNMTHDFYQYDTDRKKRIGDYNLNENGILEPRLTSARLSTGFRFSGKRWTDKSKEEKIEDDSTSTEEDLAGPGLINPMKNTLNGKNLWSTNLSLSYSYSATNPDNPKKTFWVNTSSSINVTQKWRVSYRARFDMIQRDLVSHSFSVNRDLHCWELSVNWSPTGLGQGINFKLNVKSPTLKDIKIEKKSGVFSGPRF